MSEGSDFYRDMLDNLYDGIYFVDRERNITFWNKGAERITGYSKQQIIGHSCQDNILNHIDIQGEVLCTGQCPLVTSMENDCIVSADVYLHHANGHRVPVQVRISPIKDKSGKIIGAVETFTPETEDLDLRREIIELRQTLQTDPLTGIGNRMFIEGQLHAALAQHAFSKINNTGVVYFDIDNFKAINDSYSHVVGDKVLKMVTATAAENLRRSDAIGRWGGEEFLVILQNIASINALKFITEKLRVLVECSRLDLDKASIQVTASFGATLLRPDDSVESVIHRVDTLMYQSKDAGRNRVTIG